MTLFRTVVTGRGIAIALTCSLTLAVSAHAQSVVERTPNLAGGWVGVPHTLYFNFLHRFTTSAAPEKQVSNTPTFLLAYAPLRNGLLGLNYATRSDIAARFPNEYELFARYRPWDGVALQAGYNNAARSADGELSVTHSIGRLTLLAAGRAFSNAYAGDSARFALAGGAALRLSRFFSLAGDVAALLNRTADEKLAWGGALQIAIPATPHTLSLQVANTNTGTLEGSTRGTSTRRYGFEFTIPLHLARFRSNATNVAVPAGAPLVTMKALQFTPQTITIAPGATVAWRNQDQLAHTVTAADGSWTSALLQPGSVFTHTFSEPGRYEITCTPHPFMKMLVEVTE